MTWFKVDDGFNSHPKTRRAGLAAVGLWTVAGSWSAQHKQDGFVPDWFATSWPQGRRLAALLVTAGLWETSVAAGEKGWRFRDWDDYQQSLAEIEREREHARERQRKFREKRQKARLEAVPDP